MDTMFAVDILWPLFAIGIGFVVTVALLMGLLWLKINMNDKSNIDGHDNLNKAINDHFLKVEENERIMDTFINKDCYARIRSLSDGWKKALYQPDGEPIYMNQKRCEMKQLEYKETISDIKKSIETLATTLDQKLKERDKELTQMMASAIKEAIQSAR